VTALELRCSALPMAFLCAGSVRRDGLGINETNAAATVGTAAHEALAVLVETGRVDWPGVPEIANRHGVDEVELRVLLAHGVKLWAVVKASIPAPRTEVELGAVFEGDWTLTGHADILGRSGNTAHVGDWKGGRLDSPYREQLIGYAALALLEDDTLEAATAAVLWLRDGEYERYALTRAELPAWIDRLYTEVVEWSGVYRPGNHCDHCPRRYVCPARNAMMRADLAILLDTDVEQLGAESSLATAEPDRVLEVTERLARFEKMNARWREVVREHIEKHGDIVGTAHRLTLQESEKRRLDVINTFPVLEAAGFDAEDFARVIEISASKAEQVVAKRAEKRKGAAAVRELQAQLAAADAIQTSTITSLVVRRV
jgi:hypothetical protein